ncbi:MAG TPA: amidohydrolase family protein [Candidatus Binataceae bacterium]|nr:amidohydrolase family protein [Candidatus Binataceae bacterium]
MAHEGGAAVRARLNHPVIDADGHWREFPPLLMEDLRRIGGSKAVEGFQAAGSRLNRLAVGLANTAPTADGFAAETARRRARRELQGGWWQTPWGSRDRATAVMPKLLYERLDEIGLDFIVLFPTYGLSLPHIADEQARRACCRAYNSYLAERFASYSDRITPVAPIPMHTPDEAIAELEHAVSELGLKAVMMGSLIRRSGEGGIWLDPLGIDSAYDYDPVWAKCQELGVAPAFHTAGNGLGLRVSPSNFVYNHIGHFASAQDAVCKALFLGGVTRRFPSLRFAFMEGGAGWACNLYSDLVGHWHKRNPKALEQLRPSALNREEFLALAERFGDSGWAQFLHGPGADLDRLGLLLAVGIDVPETQDDFAQCGIAQGQDIRELFAERFYFGCEPDDPTVVWAFNTRTNPYRARLHPLFSSDISHFDVPDMNGVLSEAYELVEDGALDRGQFRDFVFANSARYLTCNNPRFFSGTRVEAAVRELLATEAQAASLPDTPPSLAATR